MEIILVVLVLCNLATGVVLVLSMVLMGMQVFESFRSGNPVQKKTLRTLEGRFEKFDLVICDEFDYISFEKQQAVNGIKGNLVLKPLVI